MEISSGGHQPIRPLFGSEAGACALERLLFNFLKLSPSYSAACQHMKMVGSAPRLNARSKLVLRCAQTYGDVNRCTFSDWVAKARRRGAQQRDHMEIRTPLQLERLSAKDLLVCFPEGLNRATDQELLTFIKSHVPKGQGSRTKLTPVAEKNLWKHIYLSYLMFSNPEVELWRIGAEAMLVDRLVGKIDPAGRRMNAAQDHERRHLTLTVIRHHGWAFHTAEQAAVDDFPCKVKPTSVQGSFDFTSSARSHELFAQGPEEMGHAREKVIQCSGSHEKVSVKPTLHHQGLLF